jgi:hypothetical protein
MSRTDKDAPYWVRTEFYKPDHDWNCPDRIPRLWQHYHRGPHGCTLPPEPVRLPPQRQRFRTIPEVPRCRWVAVWPRRWRYNYTRPPSRKDRHFYWWGPERANVRNVLAKAKRQYNGCGEVDVVEPVAPMRHAMYSGGWWD